MNNATSALLRKLFQGVLNMCIPNFASGLPSARKLVTFRILFYTFKDQLQIFYKLMSYERAFKMLNKNMCITEIGQAVLEL